MTSIERLRHVRVLIRQFGELDAHDHAQHADEHPPDQHGPDVAWWVAMRLGIERVEAERLIMAASAAGGDGHGEQ